MNTTRPLHILYLSRPSAILTIASKLSKTFQRDVVFRQWNTPHQQLTRLPLLKQQWGNSQCFSADMIHSMHLVPPFSCLPLHQWLGILVLARQHRTFLRAPLYTHLTLTNTHDFYQGIAISFQGGMQVSIVSCLTTGRFLLPIGNTPRNGPLLPHWVFILGITSLPLTLP